MKPSEILRTHLSHTTRSKASNSPVGIQDISSSIAKPPAVYQSVGLSGISTSPPKSAKCFVDENNVIMNAHVYEHNPPAITQPNRTEDWQGLEWTNDKWDLLRKGGWVDHKEYKHHQLYVQPARSIHHQDSRHSIRHIPCQPASEIPQRSPPSNLINISGRTTPSVAKPKRTGGHQGRPNWSADEKNLIIDADARGLGPVEIWQAHFVHTIRTAKAVRAQHDYLRREGRLISPRNARLPLQHKRMRITESRTGQEKIETNYVGTTPNHVGMVGKGTLALPLMITDELENVEFETLVDFDYFDEQGVPYYLALEEMPYYLSPGEM